MAPEDATPHQSIYRYEEDAGGDFQDFQVPIRNNPAFHVTTARHS
jgi:hypothetical protein